MVPLPTSGQKNVSRILPRLSDAPWKLSGCPMSNVLKTIEANQRVLDLKESLEAFRGRVFDLGESLRDTVHEGNVWTHMEPRLGDHLVRLYDQLTEDLEVLDDCLESLKD